MSTTTEPAAHEVLSAAVKSFPGNKPLVVYQDMTSDQLVEAIKKQTGKARMKGLEMIDLMKQSGLMLLELKAKMPHGNFLREASLCTGLHERTIQRYMQMAQGTLPLRTVTPRERITGRTDTLKLIRATEFLPVDSPVKSDIVSGLPSDISPATSKSPLPLGAVRIDAEIMEPSDKQESLEELEPLIEDGTKPQEPPSTPSESNPWGIMWRAIDLIETLDPERHKSQLFDIMKAVFKHIKVTPEEYELHIYPVLTTKTGRASA